MGYIGRQKAKRSIKIRTSLRSVLNTYSRVEKYWGHFHDQIYVIFSKKYRKTNTDIVKWNTEIQEHFDVWSD